MEVIARTTEHVTGLSRRRGGSGDPSRWTALGVLEAIRASVERTCGDPSLRGRSVAIVGLGNVGGRLAKLCAKAGAELVVADIHPGRRALADQLGARWMTPEEALFAEVDVVAPCALGGVLDHETVPHLRCPVVAGAANNQLAGDEVAQLLHERGVLWAPDFVANAGGIVNIAVELEPEGYDPKRARVRVRGIGDTLRTVFDDAQRRGTTPLDAAQALAARNLRDRPSLDKRS